ncbi:MAG: hypothetical protein AVDCRST_MAG37-2403 [uncultured Rubrobacteraceae bacterium]|uniref:Uncharacterized protein n=1 Tax=uncultured Rubrobacteraceae bacterium TaxID=349277 RepID=A0A6J4QTJ3_9ACTN|nr:MAG: hypothetical protein AVDCRST_MAG37-2403 [uncultured Rubrobacteraceae bacterium]
MPFWSKTQGAALAIGTLAAMDAGAVGFVFQAAGSAV